MLGLNEIVVFVLATNRGRDSGHFVSQFESRLKPLYESWGHLFPYFFGIMGNNAQDRKFLTTKCLLEAKALIKSKNTLQNDIQYDIDLDMYGCPVSEDKNYVNVLRTNQCNGAYFGAGPTCRAETSLLLFLYWDYLAPCKWFLFADDDIYIRPFALTSFFNVPQLKLRESGYETSLVCLFTNVPRGFSYAKRRHHHNCSDINKHGFYFAQPAILSRRAVEDMKGALERRAMTLLQKYWGGSHDAILGMIIYLHHIPVISLADVYVGEALIKNSDGFLIPTSKTLLKKNANSAIIYHKIRPLKYKQLRTTIGQKELKLLLQNESKLNENEIGIKAAARKDRIMEIADPKQMKLFNPKRPEVFTKDMCDS
jgi:hypothetical protein